MVLSTCCLSKMRMGEENYCYHEAHEGPGDTQREYNAISFLPYQFSRVLPYFIPSFLPRGI